MTNILIIEDEPRTADLLKEFIELKRGYRVIETLERVDSAVQYLENHQSKLDLIFLDIHLADGECFYIFNEIDVHVPVIFCTAYDEYLMKAFKHNGIDYILKPFRQFDIQEALSKYEGLKFSFVSVNLRGQETRSKKTILVNYREKTIPIAVKQIAVVLYSNGTTYLYNKNGNSFHVSKTMDEMEQSLPIDDFYRVNRQIILNRNSVEEIEPYFNRKVIIKLYIKLPVQVIVSRLKVSPFMKWLEQ